LAAKRKTPFTKVILNVPTTLLEDFDFAKDFQNYSRSEAIKESMRQFIIDQMPEGLYPPSQLREVQKQGLQEANTVFRGMAEATLSTGNDTGKDTSTPRNKRASKRQRLSDVYKKGK
tara:strand:+ start:1468 stop:1818 length:351 start_codon:yes stop_codon:yes gene_type:complete